METVFSGAQPTGRLTIGNYLGAIKNWVEMQSSYNCVYCIVDLHAITVPQDPAKLRDACLKNLALYIASGVNPEQATIFIQSQVPMHSELAWILNCISPIGWLKRMTQFKDKAAKNEENAVLGLFAYPVLMAADILLYGATVVPVGEDQTQHLEFARDLAGAFNRRYGVDFFKEPRAITSKHSARIMSLRDGTKKMSKSDPSDMSRINMTDTKDEISQKFKKATTDSIDGISFDANRRPEISNLINIFSSFSGKSVDEIVAEYSTAQTSIFKAAVAECVIEALQPIQSEYSRLIEDIGYLKSVVSNSRDRAMGIAETTMQKVKSIVGLISEF